MKKFLLFLLLALPFAAFAQRDNRTEDDRREDRLAQELNLTNDQQKRWLQVHREYKVQIAAVKADETLTPIEQKSRLRRLHDQRRAAQREILTPEQNQRYETFKQERKQAKKAGKKPGKKLRGEQMQPKKAGVPKKSLPPTQGQ
jgi:hypothetical protein